jgi:hypothetical protein
VDDGVGCDQPFRVGRHNRTERAEASGTDYIWGGRGGGEFSGSGEWRVMVSRDMKLRTETDGGRKTRYQVCLSGGIE